MKPRVDHVEIYVPDRHEAARWYGQVLGFEVVESYLPWAEGGGPLMITNDGRFKIALFEGTPQEGAPVRGLRRLAFRVGGEDFLRFLEASTAWRETPLGRDQIEDHQKAFSVYFTDPWGNLLEVTTYEPDPVRRALSGD